MPKTQRKRENMSCIILRWGHSCGTQMTWVPVPAQRTIHVCYMKQSLDKNTVPVPNLPSHMNEQSCCRSLFINLNSMLKVFSATTALNSSIKWNSVWMETFRCRNTCAYFCTCRPKRTHAGNVRPSLFQSLPCYITEDSLSQKQALTARHTS